MVPNFKSDTLSVTLLPYFFQFPKLTVNKISVKDRTIVTGHPVYIFFIIYIHFFSTGMHHMQPHAAPAPPMPQMEMDEPPNKKARGKLLHLNPIHYFPFLLKD